MRAQLRKLVWASGVTVIEVKESDREASCATAASNAIVVTVQSHGAGKAAGGRNGKVHRLGFSNGASHRVFAGLPLSSCSLTSLGKPLARGDELGRSLALTAWVFRVSGPAQSTAAAIAMRKGKGALWPAGPAQRSTPQGQTAARQQWFGSAASPRPHRPGLSGSMWVGGSRPHTAHTARTRPLSAAVPHTRRGQHPSPPGRPQTARPTVGVRLAGSPAHHASADAIGED